jgi:hypothetical protein
MSVLADIITHVTFGVESSSVSNLEGSIRALPIRKANRPCNCATELPYSTWLPLIHHDAVVKISSQMTYPAPTPPTNSPATLFCPPCYL